MMSLSTNASRSSLQLYKRPRLSNDSSSDVYSNVKRTAENLMMQQASWKTECEIISKRLEESKAVIQEQQKRIVSLSEVKGKLNGIVSEQQKALDRFKFGAVEAETLHAATKEQISKALQELKEGKADREKMSNLLSERHKQFLSLESESESIRKQLDETRYKLQKESKSLEDERALGEKSRAALSSKESELLGVNEAKVSVCEELASSQNQNQEQKDMIAHLQNTISSLEITLVEKEQAIQEFQKQLETQAESHLKVANYMEEQLSHQKIENESLREKVAELQSNVSDAEGKITELTSQNRCLEDELVDTKARAEASTTRESQLRSTNEELVLKLQEITLSHQQISTEFAASSKLNDGLKNSCQQNEQKIIELGNLQEQLIAEGEAKLSSAESLYTALQNEHQQTTNELEKATEEMVAMENDMKQLLLELDASSNSIQEKDAILTAADKQLGEFEAQYESVSELAAKRELNVTELTTTKGQLEEELEKGKQEMQAFREESDKKILQLEEKNKALEEKNKKLVEEMEKTTTEMTTKVKELESKLEETLVRLQQCEVAKKELEVEKEEAKMAEPEHDFSPKKTPKPKTPKAKSKSLSRTKPKTPAPKQDRNLWSEEDSDAPPPIPAFARPSRRASASYSKKAMTPTASARTSFRKAPTPKAPSSRSIPRERSIFSEDEDLF